MSNIDQAFINAYADSLATAGATTVVRRETVSQPVAGSRPPLRVFNHGTQQERGAKRFDLPELEAVPGQPHITSSAASVLTAATEQQRSSLLLDDEPALPPLGGERKPLSTFATPRQPATAAFRPALEVDGFRWPTITDELVKVSRALLMPVVELLQAGARDGRSLVGIAGTGAEVGTSTVAICLARLLVESGQLLTESGQSLALVDGNFARGDLASQLGLELDAGWEQVLAGQIPLAECAVHSLTDGMSLIPLNGSQAGVSERLASIQSSVIAGVLRYHHELVLFDLGAASDPAQLQVAASIVDHCRLDAGIIVAPTGMNDAATARGYDQLNDVFGPVCLGVIGNRAA